MNSAGKNFPLLSILDYHYQVYIKGFWNPFIIYVYMGSLPLNNNFYF